MKRSQRKAGKVVGLIALAGAIVATGCATSGYESLEYTQQKNRERLAAQEFASCHQEALIADQSAAKNSRPAGYLHSARVLDRCLTEVSAYSQAVESVELMRTHALMVQNYFKAGEITSAKRAFNGFRSQYPGQDLFFADQSSFIDTMSLLLGEAGPSAALPGSSLNVNPRIKAEVRRINYWQAN